MVNFYSGFITPEGARLALETMKVYREMRKRYPNEREFKTAYTAWQREHLMPRGSIHDVVDHIEHIAKIAGIDHVGIGSDFDGIPLTGLPEGMEDISKLPNLTYELMKRGYSVADIKKVLGEYLLRVMTEV